MVDVEDTVSETIVRPLERVVTVALLAVAADGEVVGMPGNSSVGVTNAKNSLLLALASCCCLLKTRTSLDVILAIVN